MPQVDTSDELSLDDASASKKRGPKWLKPLILLLIVGGVIGSYLALADDPLQQLASYEDTLRRWQQESPVLVLSCAFLLYVVVTGFSLPGAAPLSLLYAWYFRFWMALPLISFASTTGATVAMLLSRWLFRDFVTHRFGAQLEQFRERLDRDGPFYLFSLRLIPAVPFWLINLLMGVTTIRTRTFWWVSQVGMLPGTIVFVFAGSSVPDLRTLADKKLSAALSATQLTQITVAFVLLGIFPLIVKWLYAKLSKHDHGSEPT